jgi:hypothetical protein
VAQLFDNRNKAAGKKGQSDHALKLFAYHRGWNIQLNLDADWWRVVQLIEPKVVLSWAKKKHAMGGMTDDQLALYEQVALRAMEFARLGEYEFVKMGHVSSPPGTQYQIGQFVYIHKTKAGELAAIICNDGESLLSIPGECRKKLARFARQVRRRTSRCTIRTTFLVIRKRKRRL